MKLDTNTYFFLNQSSSAYFIGSPTSDHTVFVNKTAENLFGMTKDSCNISSIFHSSNMHIMESVGIALEREESCILYDILLNDKNDEKILMDLQFGYFNPEKTLVYLELIPRNQTIEKLTFHQIVHSPRAEAILNLDASLSLEFCNPNFFRIFEASKPSDMDFYQQNLAFSFPKKLQESISQEIRQGLKASETFCKEVEITTLLGTKKWVSLDLQRRIFEDGQGKILCYATNIDEKVQKTKEVSLLNQYLSVIQSSTVDILYRVDIESNVMYHYSDFISVNQEDKQISDYVDVFMSKNTIHPDDRDAYMANFNDFYQEDKAPSRPVRFSLGGRPYQWYQITAKKIFDSHGTLKEVFGALVNVENEEQMKAKVSFMNQYFFSIQSLTEDILFHIDVKTQVFRHNDKNAQEWGVPVEIPHFVDHFIAEKIIHEDDIEDYRCYVQKLFAGDNADHQVRAAVNVGVYEWFCIKSTFIYDENGVPSEIFGIMKNIHKEKTMEEEYSTLFGYFEAMKSLSDESLYMVDTKSGVLRCEGVLFQQLGLPPVVKNYPEATLGLIHPDHLSQFKEFYKHTTDGSESRLELKIKDTQGEYLWYQLISMIIRDEQGNPVEILGKMKNIQGEKNISSQYSMLHQYFNSMKELTEEILCHIDIKTMTYRHSNRTAIRLGVPCEVVNFVEYFIEHKYIHPEDAPLFRDYTRQLLAGEIDQYQIRSAVDQDTYQWFHVKCAFIYDEKGEPVEIFSSMKNIQYLKDLQNRAFFDQMTGALNKATFEDESTAFLAECDLDAGRHALIFIDLDDFKGVNDSLGHSYGDSLLATVGKRLKRLVRNHDLVGRIGGDEFAVLLKEVGDDSSVLARTSFMLRSLQQEFSLSDQVVQVKASVGVAIFPDHGRSYSELIQKSDKAVYRSKDRGKNVATLYHPSIETENMT